MAKLERSFAQFVEHVHRHLPQPSKQGSTDVTSRARDILSAEHRPLSDNRDRQEKQKRRQLEYRPNTQYPWTLQGDATSGPCGNIRYFSPRLSGEAQTDRQRDGVTTIPGIGKIPDLNGSKADARPISPEILDGTSEMSDDFQTRSVV